MRVPLSWLRDFVALDMPVEELAARLDVSTAVVAAIERRGIPEIDGNAAFFRVGRVLEAEKHPNADRLQLCRVDVGAAEPSQIVCGAWNFGAGATVAVALPGATLPGGLRLERRKIRGAASEGMILSERELELGPDHTGIIVLDGGEPGTALSEVVPLQEVVLDLEITGNRPDLLSIYGLAREVATLYRLELPAQPGSETAPPPAADEPVDVSIEDFEGCPRYVGRLFREVRLGPSPPWLRARLTAAGMRPISNVVDVTNYVMLELGNPLHAFDFDTLAGARIVVRRGRTGERLRTLDGVVRELSPGDLMIADADHSIALAGIMGGQETEITERTANVLLEAANFEPTGLWRTSERLRLRTEGSTRWEKGVDPHLAGTAAARATQLLLELTGARWTGATDVSDDLPQRPVVRYHPARTDSLLGLEVPPPEQDDILARLGLERRAGAYVVPTWRARDLTREVDLVEEVARFKLDEVPFTLPVRREMSGRLSRFARLRRRVEDTLVALGLSEVYTPSLVEDDAHPDALRLPEPITVELAVLRTTLLPSLVAAAERNRAVGSERIGLWELARVYLPRGADLPEERLHVACVVEGGFTHAKAIVEALHGALHMRETYRSTEQASFHPGKTAETEAGVVGELHPTVLPGSWGAFELDLAALVAGAAEPVQYEDVITYPSVRQDLAFLVGRDVPASDLMDAAREAAGPELRRIDVFDVYPGERLGAPDKKSLAFSVEFQSPERTLSDDDAAAFRGRIVDALHERFGAELRA